MPNRFHLKGNLVVLTLLLLTGSVGALFIILGPTATERSPGVLHVGIRYNDEGAMRFARYGKNGPGARIDFLNAVKTSVYSVENLKIGRNLVPIGPDQLPTGLYTARLSAPGYQSTDIFVEIEGRMLNPQKEAFLPANARADYNLIGAQLVNIEPLL
ncbi:MAG: hypothetical protein ACON39_05680 [Coraliomargaritaceae bacterium]